MKSAPALDFWTRVFIRFMIQYSGAEEFLKVSNRVLFNVVNHDDWHDEKPFSFLRDDCTTTEKYCLFCTKKRSLQDVIRNAETLKHTWEQ